MCRFSILLGVEFRWDGGHGGAAFDAVWDERAPRREPSLEEFAAAAAAAAASTPAGAVLVEPLCRLVAARLRAGHSLAGLRVGLAGVVGFKLVDVTLDGVGSSCSPSRPSPSPRL